MIDFLVEQNSYDKMPEFLMILDKNKLKVKVIFSGNLRISVKKEELILFKELAKSQKVKFKSLLYCEP